MAVHVPLSREAKEEARDLMLSTKNLLKPATGEPIVTPSQDIVLGGYYLTFVRDRKEDKKNLAFASPEEALFAHQTGRVHLQTPIKVKINGAVVDTSAGRILFNQVLPEGTPYVNSVVDKKALKEIIADCLANFGPDRTVQLLDDVKDRAIEYITKSGMSWGMDDIVVPSQKKELVAAAEKQIDEIINHYNMGLLTDEERRMKAIEVWTKTKNDLTAICQDALDPQSPAYAMINSGARGSVGQMAQMMGMKGLVINPAGETIELPVKANFKEGFEVLEYFISTHGARKGLTDTALRTANAGYLTRRLVDVAQDVVITDVDCKTKLGLKLTAKESDDMGETLQTRLWGRVLAEDLKDAKGKVLFERNHLMTTEDVASIQKKDVQEAILRSVLTCELDRGVCQMCYGFDLGYNKVVKIGTAAGIIAAQSIGEPGTQLTMRTFHSGGVAGADITQGLPRVEELFEARPLKKAAILSDVDGEVVDIVDDVRQKILHVQYVADVQEKYVVKKDNKVLVKDGDKVRKGAVLFESAEGEVKARLKGTVKVDKTSISLFGQEEKIREFQVPAGFSIWVQKGEKIASGQQLTEGSLDLYEIFSLQGIEAAQKYIVKEIQYIYSSQGQKLNDKHIEVIIRQMFARMRVLDAKDTDLVVGDIVSKLTLREANNIAIEAGGKPAVVEPVLLGITKASLSVDSFLSAASFQETARILIDAAVSGKVDQLRGLKENVIIGKLIPVGTGLRDVTHTVPDQPLEKTVAAA